jgi:hypothetical protein
MQDLKTLLKDHKIETDKQRRISREWQDYGYRLAVELGDTSHTPIYMRLAKNYDRALLEEARIFVKGSYNARNRGKLFMWKIKELKKEWDEKKKLE